MGKWGLFSWLGDFSDKLKAIRDMSKDEQEIAKIDELLAEIEQKKGE